jgi:hypothetical protein
LRARGPRPKPVGYLMAQEHVAEVRRRRPRWIDLSPCRDAPLSFLRDARRRWSEAGSPPLLPLGEGRTPTSSSRRFVRRERRRKKAALSSKGHDAIDGFSLGDQWVQLSGPIPTADRVATFPLSAISTWYAAWVQLSGPIPTADRVATFPLSAISTWYAALFQSDESLRDLAAMPSRDRRPPELAARAAHEPGTDQRRARLGLAVSPPATVEIDRE